MNYLESKRLREERKVVIDELKEIDTKARAENRPYTAEEMIRCDNLMAKDAEYKTQIESAERSEKINALLVCGSQDTTKPQQQVVKRSGSVVTKKDHSLALRGWILRQAGKNVSREMEEACERCGVNPNNNQYEIKLVNDPNKLEECLRDVTSAVLPVNGDTAIQNVSLIQGVEEVVKFTGRIRQWGEVVRTSNAQQLPYIVIDDVLTYADPHTAVATINSTAVAPFRVTSTATAIRPLPTRFLGSSLPIPALIWKPP